MIQKNPYFKRSKISVAKTRQILRYFAMDLTATDCAELSGVSVRSVNVMYQRVRQRLLEQCLRASPLKGQLEADESYFGPRRVRGVRGRGAGGKTVVFGLAPSETTASTPRSCPMRASAPCRPSSGAGPILTA